MFLTSKAAASTYREPPCFTKATNLEGVASAVWHGSLKEEDAFSIERIQAGVVARCLLN